MDELRELHDALVSYLAEFDYPTTVPSWERLRQASAAAAVVLRLPGRFGDEFDCPVCHGRRTIQPDPCTPPEPCPRCVDEDADA